jgi:hypothetical protein
MMPISRHARLMGAAALLASVSTLALAQAPSSPPPTSPPATKPEPAPMPAPPASKPSTDPARPSATTPARPSTDKSATAPAKNPLIGLSVFSSDGSRLGTVHSVNAEPDGKVKAIHIKTGGFLGFGGKLVAIPEGKFTRSGENVQLGMSSDEVSKLPEVKEQS